MGGRDGKKDGDGQSGRRWHERWDKERERAERQLVVLYKTHPESAQMKKQ